MCCKFSNVNCCFQGFLIGKNFLRYGRLEHKMDHLACFAAGMFGLAAHEEKDDNSERWMEIAKVAYLKIFRAIENIWRDIFGLRNHVLYLSQGITNTCHESYDRTDTKLGPEAFRSLPSMINYFRQ